MLIRGISERDVEKVVVCRTKGDDNQTNQIIYDWVLFTVISKISVDNTNSISDAPAPVTIADNHYLVLTLLFLVLWLITNAVCGFWLGYRSGSTHEVSTIPRTSDDEQTLTTPEYTMVILNTNERYYHSAEKSIISHLLFTLSFIYSETFQGKIRRIIMLLDFPYFGCTSFHFS